MSGQIFITPAGQWKRPTVILTLPSGKVAELRKPSTLRLVLRDGNIPESLSQIVVSSIQNKPSGPWEIKPEELPKLADLMDSVTRSVFVNPVIIEGREPNYEAGEIALEDVEESDKLFLVGWALKSGGQVAAAASKSPDEPVADVPTS